MTLLSIAIFSWLLHHSPDPSIEPRGSISEIVADFPKLVALCHESLANDSSNRSMRRLSNRLLEEISYPDSIAHLKPSPFTAIELIFPNFLSTLVFMLGFVAIKSILLHLLGWRRAIWGAWICGIFIVIIVISFSLSERQIEKRFEGDAIVLRIPTMLKAGDSDLYPDRLPASLPAGHVMKKAHETAAWYQVEYSPGEFGWLPKSVAIEVVKTSGF